MVKHMILAGVIAPALLAEMSAFNAGNVNLDSPYGLTENEKVLLENKKKVDSLSKDYTGVDFKINKALERIEGIQTVLDDLGNESYNLKGKLQEIEINFEKKNANIEDIQKELKNHSYSIKQLKKALSELTNLVENLATSKVTKNQSVSKNLEKAETPESQLENAISLYKNKNYDDASAAFETLANMKHKPAQCNFYLGQIAYEQKKYKDAIYYYKKSSNLYKTQGVNSTNMPLILLNTANSLKELNQLDKAQVFYETLKKDFPNSKEAKSLN